MAIAGSSEEMAYWAFDMLVSIASGPPADGNEKSESNLMLAALLGRFEETLRHFVQDVGIRGRLPLERSVILSSSASEYSKLILGVQGAAGRSTVRATTTSDPLCTEIKGYAPEESFSPVLSTTSRHPISR